MVVLSYKDNVFYCICNKQHRGFWALPDRYFRRETLCTEGEFCAQSCLWCRTLCTEGVFCAQSCLCINSLCTKSIFRAQTLCLFAAARLSLQPAVRCRCRHPAPSAATPASSSILKPQLTACKSHLDLAVTGNFAANDLGGKFVDELLL